MTPFWMIRDRIINFIMVTQYRYSVYKVKQVFKEKTEFASAKKIDDWDYITVNFLYNG